MRIGIIFFCAVLMLAGCVSGPQPQWYSPGKTERDLNQDKYACEQDAALYANARRGRAHLELTSQEIMRGALIGDEEVLRQKRFKQCMQSKGYELR